MNCKPEQSSQEGKGNAEEREGFLAGTQLWVPSRAVPGVVACVGNSLVWKAEAGDLLGVRSSLGQNREYYISCTAWPFSNKQRKPINKLKNRLALVTHTFNLWVPGQSVYIEFWDGLGLHDGTRSQQTNKYWKKNFYACNFYLHTYELYTSTTMTKIIIIIIENKVVEVVLVPDLLSITNHYL